MSGDEGEGWSSWVREHLAEYGMRVIGRMPAPSSLGGEGLGVVGPAGHAALVCLAPPALTPPVVWDAANHDVVLAFPYVGRARGERLRRQGVQYVDAGGNASITQPGMFVRVEGRPRNRVAGSERRPQWLGPAGMRVLYVLLTRPGLVGEPLAYLAAAALASEGTAHHVVTLLQREEFLVGSRSRRRLRDRGALSDRWVALYPSTLLPTLRDETYGGPDPAWWSAHLDTGELPPSTYLSGEAALEHLHLGLRAVTTTLYTQQRTALIRAARLDRRAQDPTVSVRRVFWDPEVVPAEHGCVHPLLILADAVATRDTRQIETARQLWREFDDLSPLD